MLTPPALPTDSTISPLGFEGLATRPAPARGSPRWRRRRATSTQQSACAVSVSSRPLPAAAGTTTTPVRGPSAAPRAPRAASARSWGGALESPPRLQHQHHGDHGDGAQEQVAGRQLRFARLVRDRRGLALRGEIARAPPRSRRRSCRDRGRGRARVLLDERPREEAAGQRIPTRSSSSACRKRMPILRAFRDLAQAHAAHFAFPSELFREPAHRFRSSRPRSA